MNSDPALIPATIPEEILARVEARGVSRRDFIKFCTMTTAALALPVGMVGKVAAAVPEGRLLVPRRVCLEKAGAVRHAFA